MDTPEHLATARSQLANADAALTSLSGEYAREYPRGKHVAAHHEVIRYSLKRAEVNALVSIADSLAALALTR